MIRRTLTISWLALGFLVFGGVLKPTLGAQTFSPVYDFGTKAGDPALAQFEGMIAQGRDGNLYSTTPSGGANNLGAAFKVTLAGKVTVIHSFDVTEGSPRGGLTLGTDGNFYGTTEKGGTLAFGTVFKLSPSGTYTVLHNFAATDGAFPQSPPVLGPDGNFYGTTTAGGNGNGVVYRMTPSGTVTTLREFIATDGDEPSAPLVLGADGNFYGTAPAGGTGSGGFGVVYKVTRTGILTVLVNFDTTHGAQPYGPLVQGSDGNFYGTTASGGSDESGVVFKMTPAGKLTVLHNINGGTDGAGPYAGLVQATDGNLYGVNSVGSGVTGSGTIFRITPTGTYTVLHAFDSLDGAGPEVTMVQHTNGTVFGDTRAGGINNVCCGVFYSLGLGAAPFVSVMPSLNQAKVGRTIQILGQGFTGTTAVSFHGTLATFTVVSGTFLTAIVPAAATTGAITITTPSGTLTSNKTFRVQPQLTSFTPSSGVVGTQVVLTGVSLTQATKIAFGGKAAAFTVNSNSKITATVPTGAVTGKIDITTAGGVAASATSFTVTP